MERDLENVIPAALETARAACREFPSETELAVRVVCHARPEMTASSVRSQTYSKGFRSPSMVGINSVTVG